MYKNSKIYIAGHTGLLGSAILGRLISDGYMNIITKSHDELDLIDQKAVDEFFKKERPEYVFLCAGLTGGIVANKTYPATFLHTNIAIQDNAFEAANKYRVRHLIFYGSSCVYPKNCPQPMKEDCLLTGEIEKTSEAYAIAKIVGIIASRSYNNQFKTNRFIVLIPNSMYGPNDNFDPDNSHVLSALIKKFHEAKIEGKDKVILWGSGNPKREFVFSEDVAGASIFAMMNADKLQNTHYNIGTSIDYSIKELADVTASIVGYDGKISWDANMPDGALRKLLDCTFFSSLGWRPSISLKEGIQLTYEWFQKNEINQKICR